MRFLAIMLIVLAACWIPLPAAEAAEAEAKAVEADTAEAKAAAVETAEAEPPAADAPKAPEKAKAALAPADLSGGSLSGKDEPLDVEADQIVYSSEEFTCTGNVIVTRGKAVITCENIVGTLIDTEKTDSETGEKKKEKTITRLVATGSPIKVDSEARKAQCLKIVYELSEDKVTLTGSPENRPVFTDEKGRTASGDRIIYMVKENRWVIEGGDGGRGHIQIPAGSANLPK